MPYSHTTFFQAKAMLSNRLADASKFFWTDTELGLYLVESLRVWGSLTGYWRERGTLQTTANVAFYDLSAKLQSLVGYNLTDQNLVNDIQYALMESANNWAASTSWSGTSMFTMDDLSGALQRRRDQFLKETGVVLTNALVNQPIPGSGRIALSDNVIDIRRIAAKDSNNYVTPLFRDSEFAMNSYLTGWAANPSSPIAYTVISSPPLILQLSPAPSNPAQLDLTSVNSGASLDVTKGIALGIPDNFAWVIKWGALADLLSRDGPARDAQRAEYAQQRWETGLALARMAPGVVNGQINGVDCQVQTLYDLDTYTPTWQNPGTLMAPQAPTSIATAGLNLVAASPLPDGVYSLTVDVVRNAVVPSLDGDFMQVGREELDSILDYAEHLAMFKCGGAEFAATMPLLNRFVKAASVYNDRLSSWSPYVKQMEAQGQDEIMTNPRRKSDKLMPELVGG